MKQILQSLKTGNTEVAEVPCPAVKRGQLLIRSSHTLVSAGTERMLVEFGKANWIDKARMVLDKIKTDGFRRHHRRNHRDGRALPDPARQHRAARDGDGGNQ